ncbi:carbohydrate-binding module family 35 protein [Sodiomyces alcalophilus JCM 7366]|uniref:carbohydrate-binding module family 35 protein n=1 Tax=Sodiomyces alcalophilus JCM 7366 TaxID=591952 RepID=UPI0039B486C7
MGPAPVKRLLPLLAALASQTQATTVRSPTPPMGWNSYNTYNCLPTEDDIKSNAEAIVRLGLADLGYSSVTTDCGWMTTERGADGRLQWNETLFPSGGKALGDAIHELGLEFGLYSGAGYYQCGSTDLPASLGYEEIDAASFAEWGGDTLKYDNCYSTSPNNMVDADSEESRSPARFQKMAAELDSVDRDIKYFICQWGIGFNVGEWASEIGNTWRISNDIYNGWRSIWRITNEAVRYYKHTTVGAFADWDMLTVGLGGLSYEEERFHFGMWAIGKSPLLIGADLGRISEESLAVLSNEEIIAINQDPLAKQAQLVRRHTEEEWDVFLGELSGSRLVLAVANWRNESQTVEVDLASYGIASATARNVWKATDLGVISGQQTIGLEGHELQILVLSDISEATPPQSVGYYPAAEADLRGSAQLMGCSPGDCEPVGSKVGYIGSDGGVTFSSVQASSSGTKLLGIDYINYEYDFHTAWGWGTNTRNMTVSVNGGEEKRWAFPVSGGDWWETGRLMIEVDGFEEGEDNQVAFGAFADGEWAPDLVGLEVFE